MAAKQSSSNQGDLFKHSFLIFAALILLFSLPVSAGAFDGTAAPAGTSGVMQSSSSGIQMPVPSGLVPVPAISWADIETAVLAASGDVLIEVMNDITADFGAITIPAGTRVYLRSNPNSLSVVPYSIFQDIIDERHFIVDGGELSIGDIQLTRTVTAGNSGGIVVQNGQLEMFAGSVISNNMAFNGGGVNLAIFGSFTMNGGVINGNTATSLGGGIYIDAFGSFTMTGGEINGNVASNNGGGVFLTGAVFIMEGGTISGNTANSGGGGVLAIASSNFIMHDGIISNNEASRGGGVHIMTASFTMNNGIISDNTATLNGGGIFTGVYAWVTTSDTAIFSGNTASSSHDFSQSSLYPSGSVSPAQAGALPPPPFLGGIVPSSIQWSGNSIAGTHLLNNYDINFVGYSIPVQLVTFDSNGGIFTDSAQQQTRLISSYTGVTYSYIFNADGNLLNLPLPRPTKTGYTFGGWFDTQANANGTTEDGRVLSTHDVTSDASRTLYARWTLLSDNGGGGGSGTGNATILDPPTVVIPPEPPKPPVTPEPPEPPGPAVPVTVILLFAIGIAAFVYRKVEEAREKDSNP